MPDISPGPQFDHSPSQIITREELISLLSRVFEREHGLAAACLFAACSLKNDASEGGLNEAQASLVRGWRHDFASVIIDRMRNLAQIANLLTAIGGAPPLARPNFSQLIIDSSEAGLSLEAFSLPTLDLLAAYGQANANYDEIIASFRNIAADELFIGPKEAQASAQFLNLGDKLTAIVDQASAGLALASLATDPSAEVLSKIRGEYIQATADAQRDGVPFEPVRPVGKNPRTHLAEGTANSTRLVDASTVAVANLFNGAYDTMLLMFFRFFAHTEESDRDLKRLAQAALRLLSSVIRPLSEALMQMPADSASQPGVCAGPTFGDSGNVPALLHQATAWALFDEHLYQLACAATQVRVAPGLPTEIQEATAALQDLTCQFAPADGPHGIEARLTELKRLEAELGTYIQASTNGPYLVTNVGRMVTWLGEQIPTRPQMALCRCGNSATKPFCDGTHARIDFTGQKDPNRVPDRRDTYVGTAITVLDNRGICAHSGFCTDRLNTVFHVGKDPFVSPNGARMDEIIRAVRACPSGALSYAVGGKEVRDAVDQDRPPTIEVSKDGPYRVTGWIEIRDGKGNPEVRNTGSSKEHYSLCRCGHSYNKPFCSGMHWYVNFHDPVPDPDHEPTLFEWVGGFPALLRMTHLFYDKYIPQEPLLRPLFAEMSPDHPERVAAWLGEVFGGPKAYSSTYGGYERMLSQHIGKGIVEAQRSRWATLISMAADEAGVPADPEFRSAFMSYIEWGTRLAVENSAPGSRPPPHMPMPRWDWGTAGLPGSRISATAPADEATEEVKLPTADEDVHFKDHIKPLFRQMDRQSMKWAFDLWAYDDVSKHAEAILKRLQKGTMPCDGAWPAEKIATFQRWMDSGMKE